MRKKFRIVGVGGTFDEFHKGHRALLMKAFDVGEHVMIGISSDQFAKKMVKPHRTAPYTQRLRELKEFLDEHGLLQRAEIFPIDDPYGESFCPTARSKFWSSAEKQNQQRWRSIRNERKMVWLHLKRLSLI